MSKNEVLRDNKMDFTAKEIETLRNTVAEKATEDEFRMFMHLAKSYGLDPFNGEIFFWKMNGRPTIMTSRDGYLKIADSHPSYDGLVSDVVRENDLFKRKQDGIVHEYSGDRGAITGAYALVYREDRRYPVYVFAPFEEYNAGTKVWASYPSAMILKVAESMALKRAFSVSGLVSREELDMIQNRDDADNTPEGVTDIEVEQETTSKDKSLSKREEEIKKIIGNNDDLKKDMFSYLKFVKEDLDLEADRKLKLDDLTAKQYKELKDLLLNMKKRHEPMTA
ncbi:MAG: recombinase RecT [Halanaerobiales bacterium]|nr:recombinase RecT [Halanaerobiales bacterium]